MLALLPSLKAARDEFNEKARLAEELAWKRFGYETPPDHPTPELRKLWCDEFKKTGDERENYSSRT